jgi:hypothetical protein
MPDEAVADLRRRIAARRWPSRELVADRSQGVQLATLQELARYWAAEAVGPLTDPTAHGGTRRGRVRPRAAVPARLRLLRRAARDRLGPGRIARAWAELMHRLGCTRYVAQGGDQGASITDAMGRLAPRGCSAST